MIIITIFMTDWHAEENRETLKIACFFSLWIFVMYFPAAYARVFLGFERFVNTERYRYLPCIPAAGLVITAGVLLQKILSRYTKKSQTIFLAVFISIIFLNYFERNKKIDEYLECNREFYSIVNTYIKGLKDLVHSQPGKFQILDDWFMNLTSDGKNVEAGWNAQPSTLAYLYLKPGYLSRVSFISVNRQEGANKDIPLYRVKDGHIYCVKERNK